MKGSLIQTPDAFIVYHNIKKPYKDEIMVRVPYPLHPDNVYDILNNPCSELKSLIGQDVEFKLERLYHSPNTYSVRAKIVTDSDALIPAEPEAEEPESEYDYYEYDYYCDYHDDIKRGN